ncbi:MAG: RNA-binding protein [Verrucomicrobia bacterium]|nr:RNA-binding protein [Verrucomicrobiota bacterium]
MGNRLYVGNLSFHTTDATLQQHFSQAGPVTNVSLIVDKFTGRSRGFAFVEMGSDADAQKAIEQFHGKELDGRVLTVNEARPREERPPGGGGGGGGGGGFGGGGGRREHRGGRGRREH